MTVWLKGKDGRANQIEQDVKKVYEEDGMIHIRYNDNKWGIVAGTSYYKDEMEIEKVEA